MSINLSVDDASPAALCAASDPCTPSILLAQGHLDLRSIQLCSLFGSLYDRKITSSSAISTIIFYPGIFFIVKFFRRLQVRSFTVEHVVFFSRPTILQPAHIKFICNFSTEHLVCHICIIPAGRPRGLWLARPLSC